MFYLLSKTLDLALSPVALALALGIAALGAAVRHRQRLAIKLAACALLILYVPATGLVASGLVDYAQGFDGPRASDGQRYDAVIVLGGFAGRSVDGSVDLSEGGDRLLRARTLLLANAARYAVVVAGGESDSEVEADLAAELLVHWGVPRERVLLGRGSRNTRENALEAKHIVEQHGFRKLVLVTSAFHMQRAAECMFAVGLRPDLLATDYLGTSVGTFDALAPRASYLALSERILRELAGRVVYRVSGYARAP